MAESLQGVILTADQVAEWGRKKAELERQISDTQQQLADINRRLEAVRVLTGHAPTVKITRAGGAEKPGQPTETMMDAVNRLVLEAPAPTTKAKLKEALTAAGFPKDRLGSYFYTVIMRLKQRERIIVHEDGSISPGPAAKR